MKRLYTFVFICSIISNFVAQDIRRDTVYYDQDWKTTIYPEDAKFARVVKRNPENKIVGTVRDFYLPSWKIQFEGKLMSENPDITEGKCTFYYENGNIQQVATYQNGKPLNDIIVYNEDGTKKDCQDTLVSVFPLTQKNVHSQISSESSRAVHVVNVQIFKDIYIRYRIEDDNSPNIADLAIGLMAYSTNLSGFMSLFNGSSQKPSSKSTRNTFFITTSREVAQYFIDTKGTILNRDFELFSSSNSLNENLHLKIDDNIPAIYLCIQNNNFKTAAISTLEVVSLVKNCK